LKNPSIAYRWIRFAFNKIDINFEAFIWIIGPKPYRPEKGSIGTQYIFVFNCIDDVKDFSLELINSKISKTSGANVKEDIFDFNREKLNSSGHKLD